MPKVTYFQPVGLIEKLQEELISFDELEALRLKDLEGFDQEKCAREMDIAQSTFQRLLSSARKKISRAIVNGKAMRIQGGDYRLVPYQLECGKCGHGWMDAIRLESNYAQDCPKCGGRGRRCRD